MSAASRVILLSCQPHRRKARYARETARKPKADMAFCTAYVR